MFLGAMWWVYAQPLDAVFGGRPAVDGVGSPAAIVTAEGIGGR